MSFKHLIRMAPGSTVSNLLKQNPFNPSKLEGLVGWYDFSDASTITTTSGTPGTPGESITAVVNKSADASPYPGLSGGTGTYTAAGINGRTSLGGYMYPSPAPAPIGDITFMFVAKRKSYSAAFQLMALFGFPSNWAWSVDCQLMAAMAPRSDLVGGWNIYDSPLVQPFPNPYYFANAEAMKFDGVDDGLHSNTIVPVGNGFSIAFWIRDASNGTTGNQNTIVLMQNNVGSIYNTSTMHFKLSGHSAALNKISFWTLTGSGWVQLDSVAGNSIFTNAWTHVCVTCAATPTAGGDISLYIDGVEVATDTGGTIYGTSDAFYISENPWGSPANVDLDEVAAWTSVLTPLQVEQLYGTPVRYSTRSASFDKDPTAHVGVGYQSGTTISGIPGVTGYSISVWVYCEDLKNLAYGTILALTAGSTNIIQLRKDQGGGYHSKLDIYEGGVYVVSTNGLAALDGTWIHLCVTSDSTAAAAGTAINCYVNGVLDSNFPSANTNACPGIDTATVGTSYGGGYPVLGGGVNCLLDDMSVWDTELTAAQALALYNGGQPKDLTGLPNLVNYWLMGDAPDTDGAGGVLFDRAGSADLTNFTVPGGGYPATYSANVPYVHATSSNGVGEIVDLTKHSANATLNRWYRFGEDPRGDFVDSATVGPYDLTVDNDPTVTSTSVIPGPVAPVPANIVTMSRDGTSGAVNFYLDNAPVVSGIDNTGDVALVFTYRLGSSYSQQIGEILIFDRVITDAERSACQDYLTSKYLNHGQLDFSDLVNSGYTIDL